MKVWIEWLDGKETSDYMALSVNADENEVVILTAKGTTLGIPMCVIKSMRLEY